MIKKLSILLLLLLLPITIYANEPDDETYQNPDIKNIDNNETNNNPEDKDLDHGTDIVEDSKTKEKSNYTYIILGTVTIIIIAGIIIKIKKR